jgi:hypothetical protein
MLVLDWVALGNTWQDAMLNSGVLTGPRPSTGRLTPSEAARQRESDRLNEILIERRLRHLLPDEVSRRHETAHHEAAHAIVVMAFGKALRSVSIKTDDPSGGLCEYAKGSTALETATIAVAPVAWIEQVYYREFRHYLPNGATGCDSDLRRATGAVGYDMQWNLGKAFTQAREILRENFDETVALADKLDRDGVWRP